MIVQHDEIEDVSVITVDDGKANAVNPRLIRALSTALTQAERSSAVILRGRPGVFSAGLDLNLVDGAPSSEVTTFLNEFNDFLCSLLLYPRPLIAECTGHAIGAGCLLLVACDIRVGTPRGRAGVSGVHLGLPFPSGALAVARTCMNKQALNRTMLLGEVFSGDDRLRHGLLSEIVPEEKLQSVALHRARDAARVSPVSFSSTRTRLREDEVSKARQNAKKQNALFLQALEDPETQERIRSVRARVLARNAESG